jgi:hypothetical protein
MLASACGSGDDNTNPAGDSGMGDSTVEGGGPDTGSDAQVGPDSTVQDGSSEAGDGASADSAEAGPEAGAMCTPFDAGTLDDAAVAAGLQFILSTGHCNRCHQTDPDAGIMLSGNMNSITDAGPVFPPNLTPDPATGIGCWSNDQIANAILFGVDPESDGGALCRLMPKFGVGRGDAAPPLSDASIVNVVEFLRSLSPVSNQVMTTMCPAAAPPPSSDAGEGGSPDAGDAAGE